MQEICILTDKDVLGSDGLSHAQPRHTARAILKNAEGMYAVMYSQKFDLYSLPGGGVEDGETPQMALCREILEETGCTCDHVQDLGIIRENRFHADYTQISYYYVVTTTGAVWEPVLTESEKQNKTDVQWHSLERVVELITQSVHTTNQRKFLQARDAAALDYYMEEML